MEQRGQKQQSGESEMRSWGLITAAGQAVRQGALASNYRMEGSNPKSKIQNSKFPNPASRTPNPAFTLFELIVAMAIMLLLASIAMPLARVHAQRLRELELRRDLRDVRQAIDRYKDFSDRGMIPPKADGFGYPPDLDTLVKGVELKGSASTKYKFLRKIPPDPMTGKQDWGMRSMQDDPDSRSWGGQNVFDIYSQSQGTALDGTKYADW
jgi:general secretion pathway protein G